MEPNNNTPKTVRIKAYRYEQLGDDAREKVARWVAEIDGPLVFEMLSEDVFNDLSELLPSITARDVEYSFGGRDDHVKVSSRIVARHLEAEEPELPDYVGYGWVAHLGGGMMRDGGTTAPDDLSDKDRALINAVVSICRIHFNAGLEAAGWFPDDEYITETCDANGYLFDQYGEPIHHLIEATEE